MVITVTCPSCAASFPVDSNKIPPAGVSARCSSCSHVFRIERPAPPPPPPPEPEPEPEPEVVFAEPEPEPEVVFAEPEPEPEVVFAEPEPEPEPLPPLGSGASFAVEVEEAPAQDAGSADWVFETAEDIDPASLDIEPMETVESSVAEAREDDALFAPAAEPEEEFIAPPAPESDLAQPIEAPWEPVAEPTITEEPVPPQAAEPAQPVGSFTFGRRDPKEKARRLARVLVSDMIMYNPQRHERALANGTLREDFEDEIAKSWKEYVEQVGEEMATENPFWAEALNDVLAKGEQIF